MRIIRVKKAAEDDIPRKRGASGLDSPCGRNKPSPFPPLARTRDNPRVFTSRLNAKKRQVQDLSFFGAEDEIRTRATVSHTTPLAGEPLEPLGYFCVAQ